MAKQTYKYVENQSILYGEVDQYELTTHEYNKIYNFYVTYSICGKQSMKKRSLTDYGWENNSIVNSGAKNKLESILKLDENYNFIFTYEDNLKKSFSDVSLEDGQIIDFHPERAAIGKTKESNKYFKLFYRIRNGLAHGRFILRYNSLGEKMVLIQDNDTHNVTARIVLKLETILRFIDAIDKNESIPRFEEGLSMTSKGLVLI